LYELADMYLKSSLSCTDLFLVLVSFLYAMNLDAQIQQLKHTAFEFCSAQKVARTLADTRLDYVEQRCMMQQGRRKTKSRSGEERWMGGRCGAEQREYVQPKEQAIKQSASL
jgi:hypothetical protein